MPPELLREKLIELNGNGRDVDAIIQVGTNLSMVRLAAAAEMWLGKPVIAINTATYWHALRQNKITDKIPGLGACWRSSSYCAPVILAAVTTSFHLTMSALMRSLTASGGPGSGSTPWIVSAC